jgi:hypothetical protein
MIQGVLEKPWKRTVENLSLAPLWQPCISGLALRSLLTTSPRESLNCQYPQRNCASDSLQEQLKLYLKCISYRMAPNYTPILKEQHVMNFGKSYRISDD